MKLTLKMPRLGMNMQAAILTDWLKRPGDQFSEGDALYSIEVDKGNMEVPAPGRGRLVEIVAPEGTELQVGAAICVIELIDGD